MGNLSSFAAKELPYIRRKLRAYTIGALAAKPYSEIIGAQCCNCGTKTWEWIVAVCREFRIEPPKHESAQT
jgi:hypothetical protein